MFFFILTTYFSFRLPAMWIEYCLFSRTIGARCGLAASSRFARRLSASDQPDNLPARPVNDHSVKSIATEHCILPLAFGAAKFKHFVMKIIIGTQGEFRTHQWPVAAGATEHCTRNQRQGVPVDPYCCMDFVAVSD
jgi:hypothetical protein